MGDREPGGGGEGSSRGTKAREKRFAHRPPGSRERLRPLVGPCAARDRSALTCQKVFGEIQAGLARHGQGLADADLQIAATAIHHGLEVVTGNVRHFERIPGIRIQPALATARHGR